MDKDIGKFIECFEEVSGTSPRTSKEAEDYFLAALLYLVRNDIDVISPGLREAEQRLIERGLAKMYFSALRDVLGVSEGMNELEELLMLLQASAEDRHNAVAITLNMTDQNEFNNYIDRHH